MYSLERLYLQRRQVVQSGFRSSVATTRRRSDGQPGGRSRARAAETDAQRRDRVLGHLRHCMLFFLSNLFFYLQVMHNCQVLRGIFLLSLQITSSFQHITHTPPAL
jgi:hypothetical protein